MVDHCPHCGLPLACDVVTHIAFTAPCMNAQLVDSAAPILDEIPTWNPTRYPEP